MDIPLLKYLDILIGLSVAMLIVSTVVMALAQVLLTSSYARARYLAEGLGELLGQVDPVLLGQHQEYLAQRILRHPMIGRGNTWFGEFTGWARNLWRRNRKQLPLPRVNPGSVMQREELVAILLEWASGEGPMAQQDRDMIRAGNDHEDAGLLRVREALAKALLNGGIADPAAVAKRVRQLTLEQERANPQLPSSQWRTQAVLDGAASDFTWRLFSWHDNTLERIKAAFALEARVLSCVLALIVCFAIKLDGFELVKRLTVDGKYLDAMVARATVAQKHFEDVAKAVPSGGLTGAADKALKDATDAKLGLDAAIGTLKEPTLALFQDWGDKGEAKTMADVPWWPLTDLWSWSLTRITAEGYPDHIPGLLFSWILVSLGATFWYDLLKKLMGLRSLLAKKDDEERTARDASQQSPGTTPLPSAPDLVTVIDSTPKLVAILTTTRLRSGRPEETAPEVAVLGADTLVSVAGAVRAANGTKWYQTPDGDYFPASASEKP